jgi:ribonuclease P protein component
VAAASGGGERLPGSRRIRRGEDIRALFQQGKRSRTAHLDVFDFASPFVYSRAGLVVPRHRHTIVERNLIKRRLREVLRREVLPRLGAAGLSIDVLVRARREAYDATYAQLRDELVEWTEKRCLRARSS